jgi:uncharacterized membrane protein
MRAAWIYAFGNIAVLLLELSNFILRASANELSFIEVSLSVVSVVLLLVTGWVGWELIGLRRRMS